MTPTELARELRIAEHDAWLMLAHAVRTSGYAAVFVERNQLTPDAERAVRAAVRGRR